MNQIRVLMVDDHAMVRRGVRAFLDTDCSILTVGEAEDGEDAMRQADSLQPDVILMDLMLPHQDGVVTIAQIKRTQPQTKILVLTSFSDEKRVIAAMQAGADGYLLKDADGPALLKAIHEVQQGDMPIDSHVAPHLFKIASKHKKAGEGRPLTDRELEVLRWVVKGLSNRAVAQALGINEGTAKVHVSNIMDKMGVSSRTEAAVEAVKRGLVSSVDEE
jgi:DNA-binding NarL/FixJ family response regulator